MDSNQSIASVSSVQGNKHTNQLVQELKLDPHNPNYATIAFILWPLPFPLSGEDDKRSYRVAFLKYFTTEFGRATVKYNLSRKQQSTVREMFHSCLCVANDAQIEAFKERFGPPYWIATKSVGKL
jgi:hypothetical protein